MAMKFFTGFEWLLIDAANHFGHDKKRFEERIDWTKSVLPVLEDYEALAENKPLYNKAVQAIRKAQAGIPTGHMVGVDGVCSGIQMMSVLTGCVAGARSTGLIDPDVRADAYTACTNEMNVILGSSVNVSRGDAKDALMTSFYGSKKTPKDIFGEDTPELSAFYSAAQVIAPGAWELLQDLLASWQPYALEHSWKLPDGFDARVKVMQKVEARIEVDELDHATFTYEYYENIGSKSGLSNAANVVHSVDAYVLREMHRRCNYDRNMVDAALAAITEELDDRAAMRSIIKLSFMNEKIRYYSEQFRRSTVASTAILPYLDNQSVRNLTTIHLEELERTLQTMLKHKPFPLVTVHDEFKAHPNNVNQVRWHYKEILADIADSYLLDDLLSQVHGAPGTFNKLSFNLGDQIRKSNYGLC
jgi:hypothetical protein